MNEVPDYGYVPGMLYQTDLYDLRRHDQMGAFVDAVVSTLHGLDSNFRHLRKKPGQTAVHGHGEDSALYLFPDGTALGIDFIGAAGGANPRPGWIVGSHVYKHSDAHDPSDHGIGGSSAPAPSPGFPYPDESTTIKNYQARVKMTYAEARRSFPDPNDSDAFRHFSRYGYSCHEMPEPEAADKHIKELRGHLGLP